MDLSNEEPGSGKRRRRDSDDESDSESDASEDDRKKKKKKKHRKEKKKKEKKKKKKSKSGGAVDQSQYGKYGILREADVFQKRVEFEEWLKDIKRRNPGDLSKRETKDLFSEFAEDFNTVTLPHLKYYDFERYGGTGTVSQKEPVDVEDDEVKLSRQRREQREQDERKAAWDDARRILSTDQAERTRVRDLEHLRSQRRLALKRGDDVTALDRQIHALLPKEEDPSAQFPPPFDSY